MDALLSSNSSNSSSLLLLYEEKHRDSSGYQVKNVRKIWTFPPVCMGRRSCKIAGRKVPPFLSVLGFRGFQKQVPY